MSWMGDQSRSFESRLKSKPTGLAGDLLGLASSPNMAGQARDGEVIQRNSFEDRAKDIFSCLPSSSSKAAPSSVITDAAPAAAAADEQKAWTLCTNSVIPNREPLPEEEQGVDVEREGCCDSPDSCMSDEGEPTPSRRAEVQVDEEDDDAPAVVAAENASRNKRKEQARYVPPAKKARREGAPPKSVRFTAETTGQGCAGAMAGGGWRGDTTTSADKDGKPCFTFSQTGKCKFGTRCRFKHEAPDFVQNPNKYKRYEIDWEEDDSSANKAAALEALDLARKAREAAEGVGVDPAEERQAFERERAEREKRLQEKKDKLSKMEEGGDSSNSAKAGGKKKKAKHTGPQLSFGDDE